MLTTYPDTMPARAQTDPALASALRIGVMRLARRLRQQRVDRTLTLSQLSALATLDRHGALTPGELAAHEKVQPPSMTRIVSTLEGLGHVARTPHPTDGRQVVLAITDSGTALLREERRRREAWLDAQLRDLTDAERAALRAAIPVLEKLASS